MSKSRRKCLKSVPCAPVNDHLYNPFPELTHANIYDHQITKSPKNPKRVGKCFQLVLICQKLLRPFSSSGKVVTQMESISKPGISIKEKSLSVEKINQLNKLMETTTTKKNGVKVDASVQTTSNMDSCVADLSLEEEEDDTNQLGSSDDFLTENDDDVSGKEPFWDLDIDSAIVGDFNSLSGFSLDDHIDPHYATIRMTLGTDGRIPDKVTSTFYSSTIYQDEKPTTTTSCTSTTSSPRSGIYSRIVKPRKTKEPMVSRMVDVQWCSWGPRLSLEKMVAMRSPRVFGYDMPYESSLVETRPPYSPETPDIPRRSYGSSVINYITQLRQNECCKHSSEYLGVGPSPSLVNGDTDMVRRGGLYSPIWPSNPPFHPSIYSKQCDAPTSEPILPKRLSINKVLHQMNPMYCDDSSEDASTVSFNSPFKVKYCYPRTFSDNLSKKSPRSVIPRKSYVNLMTEEEMNRFQYMDSDLDLNLSQFGRIKNMVLPLYQTPFIDKRDDPKVPSDTRSDDENICLQPLMERSCEEEYFKRDLLSSLEYINL